MADKEIRKNITTKLALTLGELKELLGEKKFNNRLKKAVKLLTEGIGKANKESSVAVISKKDEMSSPISIPKKVAAKKKITTPTAVGTIKKPLAKTIIKAPAAKKATGSSVAKKAINAPLVKKVATRAKK